jgi:folate-dependent phosphoribosylglycinamide formyltransferase PurN
MQNFEPGNPDNQHDPQKSNFHSYSTFITKPIGTSGVARLFAPVGAGDMIPQLTPPIKPLKVVVITSVRDIGLDDQVGLKVPVRVGDSTQTETKKMKGVVKSLIRESFGEFGKYIQVAGVIVDDVADEKEGRKILQAGYSITPDNLTEEQKWIMNPNLKLPDGRYVKDITEHLPSSWRKIPKGMEEEKAAQKLHYEKRLEQKLLEMGADIVISDHLLFRLQYLHNEGNFKGRVLNIHPAITWAEDPFVCRGLTPTKDTLERAQQYRNGAGDFYTGASLHFIADEIDGGAVIADCANTKVHPDWGPQDLRWNNYEQSKRPLIIEGLKYYASNIDMFDRYIKI